MSDKPTETTRNTETINFTLEFMRRVDAKLDRALELLGDLSLRTTSVEIRVTSLSRDNGQFTLDQAQQGVRFNRLERRLDRIEQRLEIVS